MCICVCVCVRTVCVLLHACSCRCLPACQCWLACLHVFICVPSPACVCVYRWHEEQCRKEPGQHQKGRCCPPSLTICALLVVIKVSNLAVSWGLAKRGQKMSLRCSSCWAAVTIFTYLYTLIVFALLPWHWGSQSLVWRGIVGRGSEDTVEDSVTHSQIKFGSKVDLY